MARRGLSSDSLSLPEARRVALHAQGFQLQPRDSKANWAKIAKSIEAMHLLQIDSVNVLVRSHYLPVFARVGIYDRTSLDKRCFDNRYRQYFECWAHEASLVPLNLHAHMRWRMQRARNGDGQYNQMNAFGRDNQSFLKATLKHVRDNGPTRVRDVPDGGKPAGAWWGWSKGKLALETLFDQGLVTTATRQGFERIYDVPERVLPEHVLAMPTPKEEDALRELVSLAGRALGVATARELRDYFRLPVDGFESALAGAIAAGALRPVTVGSPSQNAFLHTNAILPQKAGASALLSPFDPLVWNRDRAERLFNFHYRIELYTPENKRKYGYYVLPFLHGDVFGGRVCLKADRARSELVVNAAHHEQGIQPTDVSTALWHELNKMASWLGLERVSVKKSGNLAKALLGLA